MVVNFGVWQKEEIYTPYVIIVLRCLKVDDLVVQKTTLSSQVVAEVVATAWRTTTPTSPFLTTATIPSCRS